MVNSLSILSKHFIKSVTYVEIIYFKEFIGLISSSIGGSMFAIFLRLLDKILLCSPDSKAPPSQKGLSLSSLLSLCRTIFAKDDNLFSLKNGILGRTGPLR
jgi:hypothetical protein